MCVTTANSVNPEIKETAGTKSGEEIETRQCDDDPDKPPPEICLPGEQEERASQCTRGSNSLGELVWFRIVVYDAGLNDIHGL